MNIFDSIRPVRGSQAKLNRIMDEFTANPDSMDGDFKALLAMRRTRKEKLSEQEERVSFSTMPELFEASAVLQHEIHDNITYCNIYFL